MNSISYKKWNENDINFLIKNYRNLDCAKIAELLNRSYYATRNKARELKLSKNTKITSMLEQQVIELIQQANLTKKDIAQKLDCSVSSVNRILKACGIKRKRGAKLTNSLLQGFSYNGKDNATKLRHAILYAYHYTCWDCKKSFINESDLHIHHDITQLPIKIFVLCKVCHGKRHNKKFSFGKANNQYN